MFKLLLEAGAIMFFGVKAEGANAATELREARRRVNFILIVLYS
jgi:hypothetical protein